MKKIFLRKSFSCLIIFLPLGGFSQSTVDFVFTKQDRSMISGKKLEYYRDGYIREEQFYRNGMVRLKQGDY